MSDQFDFFSGPDPSLPFKDAIRNNFNDLDRPARISDLIAPYEALISIVDTLQPIIQTLMLMPLTEVQRQALKEAEGPMSALIRSVSSGAAVTTELNREDHNDN